MPRNAAVPKGLRSAPFRGSTAINAGLVTRNQLRGPSWRRLYPDVYVLASIPDSHDLRVRAAALRLAAGALVTGRSAAHVWGAALAGPDDPVEVLTPRDARPRPGLLVRHGTVARSETTALRGIALTTPTHTAWEIARTLPLLDAVGWIDALARRRRISRSELRAEASRHWAEWGSRQATATLALCDPRAESPPESRLRVSLVLGGLPAPVPQLPVLVGGEFVARVDLGWSRYRIAIEYDGAWHADPEQLARDRRRLRALNAAGWYVYHVTSADMQDLDALVADIRALLARLTPWRPAS